MTVVALKSKAEIGSPSERSLSGDVWVFSVILLAKSDDVCLPIPGPKPDNNPPSLKPVAPSADAPMANPLPTPAVTISSLTMFFLIMDLICYMKQLEHRMSYLVLFHMDYYLLFIAFLMIMQPLLQDYGL